MTVYGETLNRLKKILKFPFKSRILKPDIKQGWLKVEPEMIPFEPDLDNASVGNGFLNLFIANEST